MSEREARAIGCSIPRLSPLSGMVVIEDHADPLFPFAEHFHNTGPRHPITG